MALLTAAQIERINRLTAGAREIDLGTLLADGTDANDLASTANGAGASLVGVEDAAANFAGATVEAVLAEIIADYAATSNGNGASKIGVEDAAGDYTASTVEGILAEIAPNLILEFSQTIGHADLTAAATSEAIALTGFPTNALILGVQANLTAEFSGGTVSAITMSIGDTGSATELLNAEDVFTGAGTGLKPGAPTGAGQFEADYSTAGLDATFTATGDNVVNLDAGSITVKIQYRKIS